MKRTVFVLSFLLLSSICFSQIIFEKGYFIDNENNRIECLIKNYGWKANPNTIIYKLNENTEEKKAQISTIKEFSIGNSLKYVRENVQIDISSNQVAKLSTESNPIWSDEQLLLKVLVEGDATLYCYERDDHKRYFYRVGDNPIQQLIYKRYLRVKDGRHIRINASFRQQLIKEIPCQEYSRGQMAVLKYTDKDLIGYFNTYNKIEVEESVQHENSNNRKKFNLRVKPGINYSSLSIQNSMSSTLDLDFDTEIGYQIKAELEFILPYNKNKWAIVLEPGFYKIESKKDKIISRIISDQNVGASIDYSYVDIPVGIRHNFFLNNENRIFVSGLFIPNFVIDQNATIDFYDPNLNDLDIEHPHSFAIEAGLIMKKWSIDVSYRLNRNILEDYTAWGADYKVLSLSIGYRLF